MKENLQLLVNMILSLKKIMSQLATMLRNIYKTGKRMSGEGPSLVILKPQVDTRILSRESS